MLVKLMERSNGGGYFVAAKFVDRSCQGTPRLGGCCRSLDKNGLESFGLKWSREWFVLRLLAGLPQARGATDRSCYALPKRSVNKSIYARELRWDLA